MINETVRLVGMWSARFPTIPLMDVRSLDASYDLLDRTWPH